MSLVSVINYDDPTEFKYDTDKLEVTGSTITKKELVYSGEEVFVPCHSTTGQYRSPYPITATSTGTPISSVYRALHYNGVAALATYQRTSGFFLDFFADFLFTPLELPALATPVVIADCVSSGSDGLTSVLFTSTGIQVKVYTSTGVLTLTKDIAVTFVLGVSYNISIFCKAATGGGLSTDIGVWVDGVSKFSSTDPFVNQGGRTYVKLGSSATVVLGKYTINNFRMVHNGATSYPTYVRGSDVPSYEYTPATIYSIIDNALSLTPITTDYLYDFDAVTAKRYRIYSGGLYYYLVGDVLTESTSESLCNTIQELDLYPDAIPGGATIVPTFSDTIVGYRFKIGSRFFVATATEFRESSGVSDYNTLLEIRDYYDIISEYISDGVTLYIDTILITNSGSTDLAVTSFTAYYDLFVVASALDTVKVYGYIEEDGVYSDDATIRVYTKKTNTQNEHIYSLNTTVDVRDNGYFELDIPSTEGYDPSGVYIEVQFVDASGVQRSRKYHIEVPIPSNPLVTSGGIPLNSCIAL